MKKILVSICALLVANVTLAQQSIMFDMPVKKHVKMHIENAQPTNVQSSNTITSTPIWSEDFANGIPATWTNSIAPWVYRGPSTTPNTSVGTQGAYGAGTPITSPTASNGFIIFDSDFYDNNGNQSGMGTGPYPTPHNGDLKTESIDLSGYTDLAVKMNSFFRTFQGQAIVRFYVNGVYDSEVEVHTDLDVNEQSEVDEQLIVRMPPSVPGNSNVQLEFRFDGTTQSNVNGSGYYFWILDDISIVETPSNYIELNQAVVGGYWIDYANYTGAGLNFIIGLDYTVTPTSQLANHPFVVEGIIKNLGSTDQNSMLKYEVYGAGSYTGSSLATPVLAASSTNTVDSVLVAATPSLSPPVGQYGVRIWAESDSSGVITAVSDTTFKLLEISDYVYGKDYGEIVSTANPPNPHPSWTIGGPTSQYHFVTRYEMYADEQLYSLKAYITDQSVVGAEVKAIIYERDTTATTGSFFYEESDNYTITAQDLGSWVDIPFVLPIDLYNGYAYECGLVGFQHPTDSIELGTSGESLYNGEHRLFDEFGLSSQSAGTPTWYYLTNTPMIRLNFDPSSATLQSFNCVGTSCVDPGDGTGSYSSYSSCEAVCGVISPSWNCVGVTCVDPGTGNGTYSSLAGCQANCIQTGLDETELSFSIYPNPSEGIFAIKLDAATSFDITVYNVLGQPVLTTFTDKLITTIDLTSFEKGIYTVELKDKEAVYIERVIIE